jgi:hypothetical protein
VLSKLFIVLLFVDCNGLTVIGLGLILLNKTHMLRNFMSAIFHLDNQMLPNHCVSYREKFPETGIDGMKSLKKWYTVRCLLIQKNE